MERKNLVDINFNSFDINEKRVMFITMDMVLKNIHKHNKMVTSFNPRDIYYDPMTSLIYFDKYDNIKPELVDNKDDAVFKNVLDLSTLAFCSYLNDYDPKDGLLNNETISKEFDDFTNIFDQDDVNYYKSILVDSYLSNELPKEIYLSDYLRNQELERTGKGQQHSNVYVKATEVGKLLSDKDNSQAAFSSQFFLVSSVASLLLLVVGFILYFINM